jgi:mxaJ protein
MLPMTFNMSMAVRRGDESRKATLDAFIVRRRTEIDGILSQYGMPRVDAPHKQGTF